MDGGYFVILRGLLLESPRLAGTGTDREERRFLLMKILQY